MMTLADAACHGRRTVSGKPAPICIRCDRRVSEARVFIRPAARLDADGTDWTCSERVHSSTVGAESSVDNPPESQGVNPYSAHKTEAA